MRKALALTVAAAMALSLAACGGGAASSTAPASTAESTASSTADAATEAAPASDINAAVFYYSFSDTYISSVRTALDAGLSAAGITYTDYDSNSNQTTQNEQIDTAIASGANLLIVNLVTSGSSDAASSICDKAEAAGIPVIFFNRAVEEDGSEGAVLGKYAENVAFVGTDAPEAGHMQGKMIGDYVVANYDAVDLNGDGVIQYAMFKGDAANVEAIYRTQYGVEDANAVITAAGKPEMEYFDASNSDKFQLDLQGNWSAQAAQEYMQTNLSQYSEANGNMIELIICNNDNMAEGCIAALNAAGYNDGTGTTIPVFGVDATDSAQQLIAAGSMTGTIKQDAQGMADCITTLVSNVANGEALTANTDSYTKDTANNLDNKIYIAYQVYAG